ncbi:MAG: response regulator [Actinomycetota bacterium]
MRDSHICAALLEPSIQVDETLLLVEDDPSIREIVALGLAESGFRVTSERDGRRALDVLRQGRFDLLILDIMLPSLDGLEVCRTIRRESQIPIVMLTAKTETVDVVAGLELGADDYVTKPFEMRELVARIRAALRRTSGMSSSEPIVKVSGLEIDPAGFKVYKRGDEVALTATDFHLLLELARNAGNVLTRDVLLNRVWNYDYLGDSRVVDMAIKRLRAKIEDDPGEPEIIRTVRGIGYRLERS